MKYFLTLKIKTNIENKYNNNYNDRFHFCGVKHKEKEKKEEHCYWMDNKGLIKALTLRHSGEKNLKAYDMTLIHIINFKFFYLIISSRWKTYIIKKLKVIYC